MSDPSDPSDRSDPSTLSTLGAIQPDQVTRIVSLPETTVIDPGGPVVLPLGINDGAGLLALGLELRYDAAVLQYERYSTEGTLLREWMVFDNPTAGKVRLAAAGTNALTTGGVLLQFHFRARDTAAGLATDVTFAELTLNDGHTPSTALVGRVTVTGSNATDVNKDGKVDATDIQLVINAALGLDPGYDCDLSGDGPVNAFDVQLIINAALGMKGPFDGNE